MRYHPRLVERLNVGNSEHSLSIKVENYAALKTLVVNDYNGRLVGVLDGEGKGIDEHTFGGVR